MFVLISLHMHFVFQENQQLRGWPPNGYRALHHLQEAEVNFSSIAPNCLYGKRYLLTTSWKTENPRTIIWMREFRSGGYDFFWWYDEDVCKRGKEVIFWLKQKNDELIEKNRQLKFENMHLNQLVSDLHLEIMQLNRQISTSETSVITGNTCAIHVSEVQNVIVVIVIVPLVFLIM